MKYHHFLVLLFLLISSLGYTQNGQISGTILDENNQPLPYANVLLLNAIDSSLQKGLALDESAEYLFKNVPASTYIIHSSLVGSGEIYSTPFEFDGKTDVTLPSLVLVNGIAIEEITVTAKKPFIELLADKTVVNVASSSVNVGSSALEVLEKSPGVIIDNDQNIMLNGKQGILVTINGKNQFIVGQELVRMLETMPSSQIEKLEIITNPSAKHDAEGNSGIINIVLKKNDKIGFNGQVSSTFRQGELTSHFHSLNLNYRSNNVNVFGSIDYADWGWNQDLNLERTIVHPEGNTIFDQYSYILEEGHDIDAKIGLDYSLSSKTNVGLLFKNSNSKGDNGITNSTAISGYNVSGFDQLKVTTNSDEKYNHYTLNGNVTHKLNKKGSELKWDTDYSNYNSPGVFIYQNDYLDNADNPVAPMTFLRNHQNTDINILATTLDFSHPINDHVKLETGLKYSNVETDNETSFDERLANENWESIPDRQNKFMYAEQVLAAYLNGSGNLKGLMIQAGLRVEQTNSEGASPLIDDITKRKYTNYFPSVSLSRAFDNGHNMSFSYSRRLERPNYRSLNPFEIFLDQYTFQKGNAFLNPQYSNSFGLNYMLGKKLFIGVNYSHTTDAITSVIEQETEANINYQTFQNLEDQRSASLSLSAPHVWNESFTSRLNYTGFYNKFKSAIPSGILDVSNLGHNISMSNEIQLPRQWNLELSGNYRSKITYGLFNMNRQYFIDTGVSKKILNNMGQLKISVTDIFKTRNNLVYIDQDDIDLSSFETNDSRRISVKLSYNFGNQKVKSARNRKTAASQESNRI